ncbi:ATP-dependent helicase [Oribacterium sp. P6A1]|uniref:ATP-dependent helicase n=1 Tax=Oribacterium sp. P6A1 TaxID=1410612 RepID=UPI00056249E4|nr:UvrD-helicase domain-containing protein [Oribacterium sp. P6A1]
MENLERILNKEQCDAVRHTEGPLLVLAGAGSGKTRVLTHRIAYLIENCDVQPWNILAITFTNKAAGEMRDRVDKIVGVRAREVWVSTFHSMCVRMLRRHIERIGYTSNFSIYDTDDQKTVMRQVFKELNIDNQKIKDRAVLSAISKAKNEGMSPEDFGKQISGGDFTEKKIAECYTLYEKKLHQNDALDFDDLLLKTVELLDTEPEVLQYYQERFRYILVDEYQDTNDIQFNLIHKLAGKYKNICVVGDDDQSIYKFRGANLENILSFEKSFPGARVIKLEQNYRSTEKILDCANAVIANNKGRKQKRLWTDKKGGADVTFQEFDSANDEAYAVVREVKNTPRAYHDQAILYRTNAQSRLMEEQCIKMNIPYQIIGGVNFYQRREIKDVLAYMKVIANAADNVAFERIINVPKRGIGDATLEKLRVFAAANTTPEHVVTMYEAATKAELIGISGKAGKKLLEFTEMVENWKYRLRIAGYLDQNAMDEESFSIQKLIESIRDDTGYGTEIKAEGTIEAETRFQNIEEIINKAADYQAHAEEPKLSEFLEEVSLVADIDRKDDNTDLLTLMTLHGAKGLEFPKVYLVGMSDGLFPGYRSMEDHEDLEEERRLCYVGITRAEEELVMTSARSRMVNGNFERMKPSMFINEIPDEMCRKSFINRYGEDEMPFADAFGSGYGHGSSYGSGSCGDYRKNRRESQKYNELDEYRFGSDSFGNTIGGRGNRSSGGFGSSGFGANSYGLSGMGSTGYLNRSTGAGTPKKTSGSGIPKNLVSQGVQKLSSLDYKEGDTVSHIKFGRGKVLSVTDGKKDFEVTVEFEKAGQKKMLASFAKLKKVEE